MKKTVRKLPKYDKNLQILSALIVIAIVAAFGFSMFNTSHAQSPYTATHSADGKLAGSAALVSGGSNANGQAVQFGAPASQSGGFLTASGTNLMLNGKVWKFIGFNAYGMAGCWNGVSGTVWTNAQLDAYFSALPPNGLTRIWAPQVAGTTVIRNIVAQAANYNQHVVLSIGNDDGNCDPTADDPNQTGEPLSFYQNTWKTQYVSWVNTLVPLLASNPTVAMWEISNEPGQNASVPEATMQSYLSGAAAAIKAVAPNQLVESGVSYAGNMNNNTQGTEADDQNAQSSPDINVLSFHDYAYDYEGGATLSGNFTDVQTAARNLNKPFIAGEAGVEAGSGCALSLSQRVTYLQSKANDYFQGIGPSGTHSPDVAGIMFWDYEPTAANCSYDAGPGDPLLSMVQNYVVP